MFVLAVGWGATAYADSPVFVDPGGTCNGMTPCFTTIQAGVNAAMDPDAADGGAFAEVLVFPGTYAESVNLSGINANSNIGDISLVTVDALGAPTPGTATISPAAGPAIMNLVAPFGGRITVNGFILMSADDDGVSAFSDGEVKIENVTADNLMMGAGFRIQTMTAGVTIMNSSASHNSQNGLAGLIDGDLKLVGSHFDDNGSAGVTVSAMNCALTVDGSTAVGNFGAGFGVVSVDSVDVTGSDASGNQQSGFTISVDSGPVNFTDSVANLNGSNGVTFGSASSVSISGCMLDNNGSSGVTCSVNNGPVTIMNTTANDNVSFGFTFGSASAVTIQGCTANDNTASGISGSLNTAPVTITSTSANNNGALGITLGTASAVTILGCTANNNAALGMSFSVNNGPVTINNTSANLNAALGIAFATASAVSIDGCNATENGLSGIQFSVANGPVSIANTSASDNGAFGMSIGGSSALTMHTCTVNNNASVGVSFGVSSGPVTLTDSTANGNGGAGFSFSTATDVDILNSHAGGNMGGGFSFELLGALLFSGSSATNNGNDGVNFGTATDVDILMSQADGNKENGFSFAVNGPVEFSNSTASSNGQTGVNFGTATAVAITGSHADDNGDDGINVGVIGPVTIGSTTADRNGGVGAAVGPAASTVGVTDSSAVGNAQTGISIEATGDTAVSTTNASMNNFFGLFVQTNQALALMEVGADENASSGVRVSAASIFVASSHANTNGQPASSGDGFELDVPGAVTVEGTAANGNDANGFDINTSAEVTITNSQANANEREGFFFEGSLTQLNMTGCEANFNGAGSGRSGITTDGTVGGPVSISDTTANGNAFFGFGIMAAGNVTMVEVRADNNLTSGVRFSAGGPEVMIASSTANNNGQPGASGDGFEFFTPGNVTVTGCVANGNDGAGFDVVGDALADFFGCVANSNDEFGFDIAARSIFVERATANENGVHGFFPQGVGLEQAFFTRVTARSNGRLESLGDGLHVTSNLLIQSVVVNNSWFQGNANDGIELISLDPNSPLDHEISGSIICDNSGAGVRSSGVPGLVRGIAVLAINAFGNWWGDASGPMHPSNPGGTGDEIIDGANGAAGIVEFDPWIDTVSASAVPLVVNVGDPVDVKFQFSDAAKTVFLGAGPGDTDGELPFELSTDNGDLTTLAVKAAIVKEKINEPDGTLGVIAEPAVPGLVNIILTGPCGLEGAVTLQAVAADLSLTKTDDADPVTAGDNVVYKLVVTNSGPDGANDVTLTDTLPAGVSFVSATPTQGSCSEVSGVVTCNLGSLANGASAEVTLEVKTSAAGSLTNTASVSGTPDDPDPSDNTASAETTVAAPEEPKPEPEPEPEPEPQEPPASQPTAMADCGAGLCGFGTFGMMPLMLAGLASLKRRGARLGPR